MMGLLLRLLGIHKPRVVSFCPYCDLTIRGNAHTVEQCRDRLYTLVLRMRGQVK